MMKLFNVSETKEKRKELRENITKAEQILWSKLKAKRFFNIKFRRQQGIGPYIVDFYCSEFNFAIEIDGDSHFQAGSDLRDERRTAFIESQGVDVIRFTNNDIYKNLNWVLDEINIYIENKKCGKQL